MGTFGVFRRKKGERYWIRCGNDTWPSRSQAADAIKNLFKPNAPDLEFAARSLRVKADRPHKTTRIVSWLVH